MSQPRFLQILAIVSLLSIEQRVAFGRAESDVARHTNSIGLVMVRAPRGSFLMGNSNSIPASLRGPEHSPQGDWDEQPVHRVKIRRDFFMSETEITFEQFRKFDSHFREVGNVNGFVTGVSWNDATAFCEWLSKQESKTYRLPTEAEWEYACRAETTTHFASGESQPPLNWTNVFGVKNMHAAPLEWCLDWHGEYPWDEQTDPIGPLRGIARVVRGGGLNNQDNLSIFDPLGPYYTRSANRAGLPQDYRGKATVGFRIVQADFPKSKPQSVEAPFIQQCVKQRNFALTEGPTTNAPYFKKRWLLPIPPENTLEEPTRAAGIHPAVRYHNHSPGLEVLPNGDLLAVYFSASMHNVEAWPDVSLIATRLRFGAEQWDMPELLFDFPDVNEQSPLLWRDGVTLHLFWGGRDIDPAFRWCSSKDNGATWSDIQMVKPVGPVGGFSPQPINSAFRDAKGVMYLSSDGEGGTSLLWASRDNGETWFDTGGRTGGRHTTFAVLKDRSILGMGGKTTSIDGYMPQSISRDSGKTWQVTKTQFPAMASNQRPCLIRLLSGRLFFASDYQDWDGRQPAAVKERGSFVALSDDEGKTWRTKKLTAAMPHEWKTFPDKPGTLGYCVAKQGPNDVIHLITTMNEQSLHFEMNEAWILDSSERGIHSASTSADVDRNENQKAADVRTVKRNEFRAPAVSRQTFPNGKTQATWSGNMIPGYGYFLDGKETWFHPNGRKQYEVVWQEGKKIGAETFWNVRGKKIWEWNHHADGNSVWTQWWSNGKKKSESAWKDGKCHGDAFTWNPAGQLILTHRF